MDKSKEKLISWLFETKAIRVCPQDRPFWYTSGTIGPYYINTHFLYGSEEKANELLGLIDAEKQNLLQCPLKVLEATRANYGSDPIYKGLIDEMLGYIKNNMDLSSIGYISGGERRDWFFSLLIAEMLDKPHLTIYKNLDCVVNYRGSVSPEAELEGKGVLHIADLITEASSYERAWIPAVEKAGGNFKYSLVVVDRKQGGEELLGGKGIESHSMVDISKDFFASVFALGIINEQQYRMISEYIDNPKESMREFLMSHPEFLEAALAVGDRTSERARLCVEKNIYGLT